jgi:hypothetical protein
LSHVEHAVKAGQLRFAEAPSSDFDGLRLGARIVDSQFGANGWLLAFLLVSNAAVALVQL